MQQLDQLLPGAWVGRREHCSQGAGRADQCIAPEGPGQLAGLLLHSAGLTVAPPTQVRAVKSNSLANVRIGVEKLICVETFAHVPQLGRFTLRNEGATIAIGKITELPRSEKADAPEAK